MMKARRIFLLLILVGTMALAQSNPVPLINNPLVPDAVAPRGPSFTLTVNGTGFVSGSTVNWNSTPLATTFVSGSQLTAIVPAANTATASTASVAVTNPAPGGGTSNIGFFPIREPFPAVSFGQSVLSVGSPSWVVAADVNNDGNLDLIVSDALGMGVLLGNGNGTFQPEVDYGVPKFPGHFVAADVNGDGNLDLVVAAGSGYVSVLLGNGDGTFQPHQDANVNGLGQGLVAGDFNGDGKLDLATTVLSGGLIAILLGNGDGTFQNPMDFGPVSSDVYSVVTGDFNGDGELDLAVTVNIKNVFILLGNGDGTFQNGVQASAPFAQNLAVADLNADGKLDLVVYESKAFAVLLGNGDATFQSQVEYVAPLALSSGTTAIADLNGDGKPDVAISDSYPAASSFIGKGNGAFGSPGFFAAGLLPVGIAAADFNRDGMIDLVSVNQGNNTVSILPQVTSVLSRTIVAFGKVQVGMSATVNVDLTNIGLAAFTINRIVLEGAVRGSYTETNDCAATLAAGAHCTLTITFSPKDERSYTGVFVKVSDSAVSEPQVIMLRGTGGTTSPTTASEKK